MAGLLASEKIVVSAPMSLHGSAARIWKITKITDNPAGRIGLAILASTLIALAWMLVIAWYTIFGILLVPYRLIRRGSRKRKVEVLRHRETLTAISTVQVPHSAPMTQLPLGTKPQILPSTPEALPQSATN